MAKSKADEFLDLVRQSGLVEPERLDKAVAELHRPEGEVAGDPQPVADEFVQEGLITPWQAENLLKGRYKGFFIKKYKLLDLLGPAA